MHVFNTLAIALSDKPFPVSAVDGNEAQHNSELRVVEYIPWAYGAKASHWSAACVLVLRLIRPSARLALACTALISSTILFRASGRAFL